MPSMDISMGSEEIVATVKDLKVVQDEIKDGSVKPTCKSMIEFTLESGETFEARVLARKKTVTDDK